MRESAATPGNGAGADDPAVTMQTGLDAGLPRVTHPGHPYYFIAPGGQVFTIAPAR